MVSDDAEGHMPDPLDAVSPLDGRYASAMAPLQPYASEAALMNARARVEIEYLIALSDLDAIPLSVSDDERTSLRDWYREFDSEDANRIKTIEVDGDADRPATNHDVKAVEYWLDSRLGEVGMGDAIPWVHFGLTSEDVNNLAYRLLIRDACEEVLLPALDQVQTRLEDSATAHRSVPMLARTHGQAASPTTYGKELAVYAERTARSRRRLERALDELEGKFGGATGTFAAHTTAEPDVDWLSFSRGFVERFDLEYNPLTTQVNPNDDIAAVFDALATLATIFIDFDRDMWRYISDGYLVQEPEEGEVGSSTMPHKVNPIDFENSEGNLKKARNDLRFLADTLPTSRLQRDLSDSTVHRTIGGSLGHWLLGLKKADAGLATVVPDAEAMGDDLEDASEVLAEAIQTALRRIGDPNAYDRLKEATRGRTVDRRDFERLIDEIRDHDPALADRLDALEPAAYVGLAPLLVDELETR